MSRHWTFSFVYFCYFVFVGAWVAFWPLWLKDNSFSSEDIGVLTSMVLLSKIFAPWIWGYLADTRNAHLTYLKFCALMSVFIFLAVFYRQDFMWLAIVIFLFSFFWNAVMPQIEVLTLDSLAIEGEQSRYTQVRVWGSIGFVVAVICLGQFFDVVDISYLPYILLVSLVVIFISGLLLPDSKMEKKTDSTSLLSSVLKQPAVISFFVVCFLVQLSHGAYYTFFSVYLESLGFSRQEIGLLWSVGVVAEIILYLVMRRFFLLLNVRNILLLALMLTVVRWLMLAYLGSNIWCVMISQSLHAFTFGAYHAVGVVIIRRFFSDGNEGVGMGLYSSVSFGVGGTLGAWLSGLLWDSIHEQTFILASVVAILACGVAFFGVKGDHVTNLER